jgi:hypothetical protein
MWVAFDVHKFSIVAATLPPSSGPHSAALSESRCLSRATDEPLRVWHTMLSHFDVVGSRP